MPDIAPTKTSDWPSVSVVIPSYNYEQTLGRCLDAVLAQTCRPFEVIVVDDHSTDRSLELARRFPVTVLQTPRNSGVAAARNLGAHHARGNVIFFVDADVVLEPGAINAALVELRADSSIVSVCGIYEPVPLVRHSFWEECRSLQAYAWRISSLGDVSGGFFSLGAIRRGAFLAVGDFNENLRQTEEIDYGERLSRVGRILLSDLVRGRHDDDHLFVPTMRKLWRRSRDRVPFYLKKGELMQGFELPRRLVGTALSGMLWLAPLLAIWSPSGAAVAMLGLILCLLVVERDVYTQAVRVLGWARLLPFMLWYLSFHTAAGLGVVAGLVKFGLSARFRKLYGDWENAKTGT
jgi:glycosyltransferase involved in cell wall biosynthesis